MKVYDQPSGNECANSAATRPYKRQSQGAWALIEEEKELLGPDRVLLAGAVRLRKEHLSRLIAKRPSAPPKNGPRGPLTTDAVI
jgi:hypothetical protein